MVDLALALASLSSGGGWNLTVHFPKGCFPGLKAPDGYPETRASLFLPEEPWGGGTCVEEAGEGRVPTPAAHERHAGRQACLQDLTSCWSGMQPEPQGPVMGLQGPGACPWQWQEAAPTTQSLKKALVF